MAEPRACAECEARLDGVLRRLRTDRGVSAARWLWAPTSGEPGHVLVETGRVTVHPGSRGPGTVVRAGPGALPLADRCVPALVVGPVLPDLPDLDGLFAELRRVLRPHGLLTMLVPDGPPLGLRARRLHARVRACWAHRSAVDHPDWLLTAADFAVMGDDRVVFRDPEVHADPGAHVDALCASGLLPSSLPAGLRAEISARKAVRDGRVALRRLVARR